MSHSNVDPKDMAFYETFQKPNYNGMVVIGAGLPRTGTTTTRHALGILLEGRSHHMFDVFKGDQAELDFWTRALEDKVTEEEWVSRLQGRGYRGCSDYPGSLFYKKLMEAYPDAKVVLTVRSTDSWYKSVHGSIFQVAGEKPFDPAMRIFQKMIGFDKKINLVRRICYHPPTGFEKGMFGVVKEGPEASAAFFNKWVDEVKRYVPKERLLVFEVKEGWKPLCDFLGVPVPDIPFPRSNDTPTMLRRLRIARIVSHLVVYGIPTVIASAVAAFFYREQIVDYCHALIQKWF